jgi:2-polyprenyl-3-methyl-5-hydroxy-6-metoxy-1,4-benzoquinol methylase
MADEFRQGGGLAFGAFELHDLQAAFTRPVFRHHLVQSWLPALPEVHGRLAAGEDVRIAEVGCGEGVAALTIAEAYPAARIDGYDVDEASIRVARQAAEERGLADAGDYDLVLAIEMIHDVPDPVSVLRTMRSLAGDAGAVLVVDERTEDTFIAPGSEMERFFYAFSPLHCLAVSMQDGGVGTGTVMRADTLRRYASDAGFSDVAVLDVEHPQFRLYRLT